MYHTLHHRLELGDGYCHFRLSGPRDAPPLLLLHGATVPGWEFDRLVPLLNAAGWLTLVPDLYGHGYSARPRVAYDYGLFQRQVLELLAALGFDRPMPVLGHSMGAALAARLANDHPDRFDRLVLAAPLLDFASTSLSSRLFALPVVGELLMPVLIKPLLMRRKRKRYRGIEDGRWTGLFREHLRLPGFGHALLSILRSGTLADQSAIYRELARNAAVEVLVLRGSEDTVMPAAHLERLRRLLPRARYVEIIATQHAFVISDPDRLAPPVIEFLGAGRAPAEKNPAGPIRAAV